MELGDKSQDEVAKSKRLTLPHLRLQKLQFISRVITNTTDIRLKSTTFQLWQNYAKQTKQTKKTQKKLVDAAKNTILTYAFYAMSCMLVMGFFSVVIYYNFLMLQDYLMPIMLALIVAMPISFLQVRIVRVIEDIENFIASKTSSKVETALVTVVLAALTAVCIYKSVVTQSVLSDYFFGPLLAFCVLGLALLWKSQRTNIITIFLIFSVFILFVFPFVFILKSSYIESLIAKESVVKYIQGNAELQALLNDYKNSYIYTQIIKYAESWGWDTSGWTVEALKEHLLALVKLVGDNANVFFGSTYSLVVNIGNMVFSSIIFFTFLFYFVTYNPEIWREINAISPLSQDQHDKLYSSLLKSATRIFLCSFTIGLVHFLCTFISFYLTGLELKFIFFALSAFFSIVPFVSTWIIWIPATILLFTNDQIMSSIIFASVHIISNYLVNGYVLSYVPGNPYYVSHLPFQVTYDQVGMSLVLGVSKFGIPGVILGPLLAGLSATVIDIFKSFYEKQQPTPKETVLSEPALGTTSLPSTPMPRTPMPRNITRTVDRSTLPAKLLFTPGIGMD